MSEEEFFNELCAKLELWRDVGSAVYDLERADELLNCGEAYEQYQQNAYDRINASTLTLKRVREFLKKDLEKSIDEAKEILNAIYEEVN